MEYLNEYMEDSESQSEPEPEFASESKFKTSKHLDSQCKSETESESDNDSDSDGSFQELALPNSRSCHHKNLREISAFGIESDLFKHCENDNFLVNVNIINSKDQILVDRFDVRNLLLGSTYSKFIKPDLHVLEILNSTNKVEKHGRNRKCNQDLERKLYAKRFAGLKDTSNDNMSEELRIAEEEKIKRYAKFQFDYNSQQNEHNVNEKSKNEPLANSDTDLQTKNSDRELQIEGTYMGMTIPVGIDYPKTKRHFLLIYKTAKFVMEDASKANYLEMTIMGKQATNPNFEFIRPKNSMNAFFNHIKTLIHTKSYTYSLEPSEVNDNRNEKKTGTESAKSDQPKILASTNMDDKSTTSNSTTKPCITNVSLDPLQENRSHEHGQDGYEDKKRTRMSKLSLFLANKKCKDK